MDSINIYQLRKQIAAIPQAVLNRRNNVEATIFQLGLHRPERWAYLQFSKVEAGSALPEFKLPYSELQRRCLWLVFYKQHDYRRITKRFANSPGDLGLDSTVYINGIRNSISIEATSRQFTATVSDSINTVIISDDGKVERAKNDERNKEQYDIRSI